MGVVNTASYPLRLGSTGHRNTLPLPTASGEENDEETTYMSGISMIISMNQSITSVMPMYTRSATELWRILLECVCVISLPPYHRLVSFTRRAIAFAEHIRIKLTTELNRPTAVE